MKEKETALNEALRAYQFERPKPTRKFWTWCLLKGYAHSFNEEERKEALEISKTLKVW